MYAFADATDSCQEYLASRGTFDSPFFPTGYSLNLYTCVGRIRGAEGSSIQLQFPTFDVENSPQCKFDAVKVSTLYENERLEKNWKQKETKGKKKDKQTK